MTCAPSQPEALTVKRPPAGLSCPDVDRLALRTHHGPAVDAVGFWRSKPFRAGLVACLLLALAETSVRVRAAIRTEDPTTVDIYQSSGEHGLRPRPGMRYHLQGGLVTINRWGLRGAEFDLVGPANTSRVLCLGSSTVYGMPGDSDEVIWPAQLARRWRAAHERPIEVLNGAMIGLAVDDMTHRLTEELLRFEPDVALISPLPVDITRLAHATCPTEAGAGTAKQDLLKVDPTASLLYVHLQKNTSAWLSTQIRAGGRDRLPDVCDGIFRDKLRRLLQRCAAADLPIALLTCPRAVASLDRFGHNARFARDSVFFTPQLSAAAWPDALDRLNAVVRAVAAEDQVTLLDLDALLPRDPRLFRDLVHLSSDGYARVAELALPFLEALLADAAARQVADAL